MYGGEKIMNRNLFPMLSQDIIYFDNGATTFKPQEVIDSVLDYYKNYSANAHRGDYDISYKVLNSIDYGVPQLRERIYFVGIRKDLYKPIHIIRLCILYQALC